MVDLCGSDELPLLPLSDVIAGYNNVQLEATHLLQREGWMQQYTITVRKHCNYIFR